jgi:predicted Zn-dependent protease
MKKATPAALAALAAAACALNPATGKREFSLMSEAQEIAIGQEADGEIRRKMGTVDDRDLQQYGILPFLDDEAQLAGVLGHEIGHVTARHSAQQYSRATGAQLGLVLGNLYTARDGDTWASIAERAGKGIIRPSTLAIMNGRAPGEQPRPGDRLKIVVAG